MKKFKNYLKTGILLIGILFTMTNCEQNENDSINEIIRINENTIFNNPDYLNIQLKLEDDITIYNSNNLISFESNFGIPQYKSSIALNSEFKTLIIPLYSEDSRILKGWLSGFYTKSGQINFMQSFANKEQIEMLDLTKGGNLVLIESNEKRINNIKNTNKTLSSKIVCGESYRLICGTIYAGNGHGETSCGWFYEGIKCESINNEGLDPAGNEGGGWQDPFQEPPSGGDTTNSDFIQNLITIEPDNPIINISEFLKCFDLNQNARITIYVDQPIANSNAVASISDKAGHSYISISQNENTSVYGFYPNGTASPYSPIKPSILGDDSESSFDVSISIEVNPTTLNNIINNSLNYKSIYDLNNYNCTDFVIQIGNQCGLNLPDCYNTWPKGGGSNPATLGQYIRNNYSSNDNQIVNNSGGISPKNVKKC